ncbi:MAG: PcfJ domain-containing protein [Treponema sp.]|jgi:hypothetical protein|nr:PcfJ domain-containing protein [Treponema sp.]
MQISTLKVLLGLGRHTKYNISKLSNSSSAKKHQFWKQYDEFLEHNKWLKEIEYNEMVPQCWRNFLETAPNVSIPINLYLELRKNFPIPIPYPLFFCYQKKVDNKEMERKIGDLADKWLRDILSGDSFYKLNKEYFTRAEVKQFLNCDWLEILDEQCVYPATYLDLVDHYFYAKIKANGLTLPNHIFTDTFKSCFTHKIIQEYFQFICNNKEHFKEEDKVVNIGKYLIGVYIDTGEDFNFKEISWQDLKQKSKYIEWDILFTLEYKFNDHFTHTIVQEYLKFIYTNLHNIRNKNEITDIGDFLKYEYINNEQDFNFYGRTWDGLRRLSDEWHIFQGLRIGRNLQEKLGKKWEKSKVNNFNYEKDGEIWIIKEITSGQLLYDEGNDMGHCVFSYLQDCICGTCFIFSVSCKTENKADEKRIATVEISRELELLQARGRHNSLLSKETSDIIKKWTNENKIVDISYSNENERYDFGNEEEIEQYNNLLDEQYDEQYDFDENYFKNIANETVNIDGKNWTINGSYGNRKIWYYANKYGPAYYNSSYQIGKEIILTLSYMNKEKMIILISKSGCNNGIFTPNGSLNDKNREYYCILRWLSKKGVYCVDYDDEYDDYEHDDVHFEDELDFPYKIE